MCYEQRLFRSWETTKKAPKRENNLTLPERDRSGVKEIRTVPTPSPERRKDAERELEEIV
jgi:hypothetical protein